MTIYLSQMVDVDLRANRVTLARDTSLFVRDSEQDLQYPSPCLQIVPHPTTKFDQPEDLKERIAGCAISDPAMAAERVCSFLIGTKALEFHVEERALASAMRSWRSSRSQRAGTEIAQPSRTDI